MIPKENGKNAFQIPSLWLFCSPSAVLSVTAQHVLCGPSRAVVTWLPAVHPHTPCTCLCTRTRTDMRYRDQQALLHYRCTSAGTGAADWMSSNHRHSRGPSCASHVHMCAVCDACASRGTKLTGLGGCHCLCREEQPPSERSLWPQAVAESPKTCLACQGHRPLLLRGLW